LSARAQVTAIGGTADDRFSYVVHDAGGNSYYLGDFQGTLDVDTADPPDAGDTLTAPVGQRAGFLASYAPSGALRFAFALGGEGGNFLEGGLVIDLFGNLFITGEIETAIDFDPGPGSVVLPADSTDDTFVASYTSTGDLRFAHLLESTTADDGNGVAVDAAGNCYLIGEFRAPIDFDPTAGSSILTPVGNKDSYFASYDPSGALRFARQMGGTDPAFDVDAFGIAADVNGNVWICGVFEDTIDFDDSDGADADDTLTSAGFQDGFVASFTGAGAFRFVFPLGGPSTDSAGRLATGASGHMYLLGRGAPGLDFDPGPAVVDTMSGTAPFLASYTEAGAFRFAIPQSGTDILFSSANDVFVADSSVYQTGRFQGTFNLAPSDPQGRGIVSAPDRPSYLVKFQEDGTPEWARVIGMENTIAVGLSAPPGGGIVTIGAFEDTTDFDPGPGVDERTSAGLDDAFSLYLNDDGLVPGTGPGSVEVTHAGDAGPGSLREAIEVANNTATPDTITFSIPGAGPHVIAPLSPLPLFTAPAHIDGLSQPGADASSWPPDLRIVLDGSSAGAGANGIEFDAGGTGGAQFAGVSTVQGLVIGNFDGYGIESAVPLVEVLDCYIGSSADGQTAAPNAAGGIHHLHVSTTLGGPGRRIGAPAGETTGRCLISGNGGPGIRLAGSGWAIQNNYLGCAADGTTPLPNVGPGIQQVGVLNVSNAGAYLIGGTNPGEGNRIVFNGSNGVLLTKANGTKMLGNVISENGAIGIDLAWFGDPASGVSANNPLDADVTSDPPNDLINSPELDSAFLDGGMTVVRGRLDSRPGKHYRIEFFSSPQADPSGFGEGEVFLGAREVVIHNGPVRFEMIFPPLPLGQVVTATSTFRRTALATQQGTSEFSNAVEVSAPTVTTLADSGPGSLRSAITEANNNPGPDVITLSPVLRESAVAPSAPLPVITDDLTIIGANGPRLSGSGQRRLLEINAPGATVTLRDFVIESGRAGQGGGLLITEGSVIMDRMVVRDCEATGDGGGIAVLGGDLDMIDTRVTGNTAAGNGGGIASAEAKLTADRCTFDANAAASGGGIHCAWSLVGDKPVLTNATFSENAAPSGSAIEFAPTATSSPELHFSTVVHNMGPPIGGDLRMNRSIVALNDPQTAPVNLQTFVENFVGGDPGIGPLRDNGGFVPTHALLTTSPAKDVPPGPLSDYPSRSRDGRHAFRSVGGEPDLGAFEFYSALFNRNFDDWALQVFGGVDDGPDDDGNGDGITNFAAHYFGVPVFGATAGTDFQGRIDEEGNWRLTYSTALDAIGTTATSQLGDTLDNWQPGPVPVETGSSTARRFWEVVISGAPERQFGRIVLDADE
jgi:predicted outer membrane repeat protein